MLDNLVWMLERSFDRSGVFFIGELESSQQRERIMSRLIQELEGKGIAVKQCPLDVASDYPAHVLNDMLRQAKAHRQYAVLIVWCLEHLSELRLINALRWFNRNRGPLSQHVATGQFSIPIVLLVDRAYRRYLRDYAGDMFDCLQPPFELQS